MQASGSTIAQYIDRDGIRYQAYAVSDPRGAVICIHGLGAHAGRWDFFAEYFRQRRIAVYALELRGFGSTPGIQGHVDSFQSYYQDIRTARAIVTRDTPGIPAVICGESLGGLIAFGAALRYPSLFAGLICCSPAFKSRMRFPLTTYFSFALAKILDPKKQFIMPLDPRWCTRDPDYQRSMDTDPREHRYATASLLWNILVAQSQATAGYPSISIPVLFLLPGDDRVVDSGVSKKVFSRVRAEDKALIEYPGMYHTLPVDIGKEKVFGDIFEWMDKRMQ